MKLPSQSPLEFTITPHSESQDGAQFTITCKQTSRVHMNILNAVTSSTKGKDLEHILELLASYSDLMSRPCTKCGRIMDTHGQFPVVRKPSDAKVENQEPKQWRALHVGCL